MTKEEYDMWIEPITEQTINGKTVIEVPNIFFKNKISEILKTHNLSAEIIIQNQQELKIAEPQRAVETQQSLATRTLQMEKPYGKEKVATSDIINSKFFTYPTSQKTKYSITETTLNNKDYIIHRGKKSPDPNEEPIGQLDTNHLRILLAIIHSYLAGAKLSILSTKSSANKIISFNERDSKKNRGQNKRANYKMAAGKN